MRVPERLRRKKQDWVDKHHQISEKVLKGALILKNYAFTIIIVGALGLGGYGIYWVATTTSSVGSAIASAPSALWHGATGWISWGSDEPEEKPKAKKEQPKKVAETQPDDDSEKKGRFSWLKFW